MPALGTAGKALLALVIAFDVAGIAVIPYGFSQMQELVRNGFPGFPGGPGSPTFPGPGGEEFVETGQVAFGTGVDLESCSIDNPLFFVTASTRVEWIASLQTRVTPADEVFLRVSRNGTVLETTFQEPGSYSCLGSASPQPGLSEGIYTYEIVVNGSVDATGSLFVQ